MALKDLDSKLEIVKKGWKAANTISLIIAVITLGVLIILFVSNISQSNGSGTKQTLRTIECGVTPDSLLKKAPDQSDFKTITEIASIDYDNEVTGGSFIKNDIPALTNPTFSDFVEMDRCLIDQSIVVVVQVGDVVRFYEKEVLQYHFAINDKLGEQNLLITYSPISDTYEVYKRNYKTEILNFGVSGKLYKNNDLLFDTKTESFWSQFDGVARVGTYTGATLEKYPSKIMDYASAKKLYPKAAVLSFDTGYRTNYLFDVTPEFLANPTAAAIDETTSLKATDKVAGFAFAGSDYAVPLNSVDTTSGYTTNVEARKLILKYIDGELLGYLDNSSTPNVTLKQSYWYTWKAFHPDTKVIN